MRLGLRTLDKEYDKSEDDIKALQSVGQVIGEVLKQLDDERCKFSFVFFLCVWIDYRLEHCFDLKFN